MNHFEKWESYIPIDLTQPMNFLIACGVVYFFIAFRYFLIVFPFYWIAWKKNWLKNKIYKDLPGRDQILTEVRWSLITSVIFAVSGVFIGYMWQVGHTKIYLKFDEYPLWWMPLSFFVLSLIHEFYFYFSHRLMHHPSLYRTVHKVHHLSLKPSPWASFSFHPIESLIEALILPLMLMFIPVHPVVFLSYLTFMTLSAIVNHLGFEVLPKGSSTHWFGKWLISGTHHSQHHKYFTCNYGLYFTFLDRWLKTHYEKYESEFRNVTEPESSR